MRYDDWKDEELLERIEAGDKEAMEYLMDRYKNLVRSKAKTLYLIGGDKEDLLQEGMIGLYKAIRDFKKERGVTFYSFAELCISRQIYTAIKHSNTKKNQPLNNYLSMDVLEFAMNPGPEETLIDRENAAGMREQMNSLLSSFEQEVLRLYLKGLDYTGIADKLGKTPKAVDNALQRIKRKLSACCKAAGST